jgi:hypothetical protein
MRRSRIMARLEGGDCQRLGIADEQQELLTLLLEDEQEDEELEDEHDTEVACIGMLIYHGANEVRRVRNARRAEHRAYLTCSELLPNPRLQTPWQVLYESQTDHAFIATMGFDVATFDVILAAGFARVWNTTPIPRSTVDPSTPPRPHQCSLDAPGTLGLVLHWLCSTMHDTSLMQIFALIPLTVSRYLHFSLTILSKTLQHMDEARVQWPQETSSRRIAI